MSSKEARAIVQRGLDRRKAARRKAESEALMRKQDQELIGIVQDNAILCDAAQKAEDAVRASREQIQERRAARKTAKEERNLVKLWIICCTVILWLASWFTIPTYAVAFIPASAVVMLINLFRVDKPIEVRRELA
jgi:hypothetical protein